MEVFYDIYGIFIMFILNAWFTLLLCAQRICQNRFHNTTLKLLDDRPAEFREPLTLACFGKHLKVDLKGKALKATPWRNSSV